MSEKVKIMLTWVVILFIIGIILMILCYNLEKSFVLEPVNRILENL